MKLLCFKFHQNRTINKEFYFLGGGGQNSFGGPRRGQGTRLQKLEKTSYRTAGSNHTENFNIPAQLESVEKSEELKCEEKERHSRSNFGDFQSPIKTSILDILRRGSLQYIRVCLLKRWKC